MKKIYLSPERRPAPHGPYFGYPTLFEHDVTTSIAQKTAAALCSPLTGVTSDSWDTPAGHRVYDACRGSSVSWVCRGSGASIVSSTSC